VLRKPAKKIANFSGKNSAAALIIFPKIPMAGGGGGVMETEFKTKKVHFHVR
jgi:hypothetical protein